MRILYTVCGSISAYKSYDIVRSLVNEGHEVKVLLTRGALEFIKPQTFRYLGAVAVYQHDDDFKFPKLPQDNKSGYVLHIELARWCQKLVIAPASANTIANLAMGKASDLLSSIFLALEEYKPVLIFPAMNTQMLKHTLVQDNLNVLQRLKKVPQVQIMPTKTGELACGESGEGKLLDKEQIIDAIEGTPLLTSSPKRKKLLIVTGATISPLDSVRYLTNPSSGLTGYLLAKKALAQGHQVYLLAGKYANQNIKNLQILKNFELDFFTTTSQLRSKVLEQLPHVDAYLSPAAIGDIEFDMTNNKIKKDQLNSTIEIRKAPDILKEVVENFSSKYIVGFAAESELNQSTLQQKWNSKPVDLLIGTKVSNGLEDAGHSEGFQEDTANYAIFKDGQVEYRHEWKKVDMANYILSELEK